jgi:hypothetical protein
MRCYKHDDHEAIAVCAHCGKATCRDCAGDTGHGIACSEACALELQSNDQLQTALKRTYGIGSKPPMPPTIATYTLFGAILALVGIYLSITRPGIDYLTFALSAVFFVMAWSSYRRYRDTCLTCDI